MTAAVLPRETALAYGEFLQICPAVVDFACAAWDTLGALEPPTRRAITEARNPARRDLVGDRPSAQLAELSKIAGHS